MSKATNDPLYFKYGKGQLVHNELKGQNLPFHLTATQIELAGLSYTASATLRLSVHRSGWGETAPATLSETEYDVAMTLHCYDRNKEWIGCFDFNEVTRCTKTGVLQAVRDVVQIVRFMFKVSPLLLSSENGGLSDRFVSYFKALDGKGSHPSRIGD